jgi:type I restriction enzyme M protein
MSSPAPNLVNKVWNYCNLLRDDGVSYGDYVEQLTYLLFLKMDYERTRPPYKHKSAIPEDYNWPSLVEMDGLPLERHYRNTLENLGKEPGILGIIFRKAQNKIQNPAHLRRLIVDLIDKEPWSALSADVKGDIYEGLLEKNAQDTKSGAGQYFTPRVLIDAIVAVMRPQPGPPSSIPPRAPVVFSSPPPVTSSRTTSSIATRCATSRLKPSMRSNSSPLPPAFAP